MWTIVRLLAELKEESRKDFPTPKTANVQTCGEIQGEVKFPIPISFFLLVQKSLQWHTTLFITA